MTIYIALQEDIADGFMENKKKTNNVHSYMNENVLDIQK